MVRMDTLKKERTRRHLPSNELWEDCKYQTIEVKNDIFTLIDLIYLSAETLVTTIRTVYM